MMSNFYTKLSLIVLLGAFTLGFSSVAKADLFVNWIIAHDKQDCPSTCGKTGLKFAIPTGVDKNIGKRGKPSFFICITQKKDQAWHPGFNTWGKNTCTTAFGDEVYHSEEYFCLCTNNRQPKIFR